MGGGIMSLMSFKLQTFNSLHQEQPTISQIQSGSIMHQDDWSRYWFDVDGKETNIIVLFMWFLYINLHQGNSSLAPWTFLLCFRTFPDSPGGAGDCLQGVSVELQFLVLLVGLASCEGLLCRLLGAGPVLALLSNTINLPTLLFWILMLCTSMQV